MGKERDEKERYNDGKTNRVEAKCGWRDLRTAVHNIGAWNCTDTLFELQIKPLNP